MDLVESLGRTFKGCVWSIGDIDASLKSWKLRWFYQWENLAEVENKNIGNSHGGWGRSR